MEAAGLSELPQNFYITQHHIQEDSSLINKDTDTVRPLKIHVSQIFCVTYTTHNLQICK
jgi:hypothetical protein